MTPAKIDVSAVWSIHSEFVRREGWRKGSSFYPINELTHGYSQTHQPAPDKNPRNCQMRLNKITIQLSQPGNSTTEKQTKTSFKAFFPTLSACLPVYHHPTLCCLLSSVFCLPPHNSNID